MPKALPLQKCEHTYKCHETSHQDTSFAVPGKEIFVLAYPLSVGVSNPQTAGMAAACPRTHFTYEEIPRRLTTTSTYRTGTTMNSNPTKTAEVLQLAEAPLTAANMLDFFAQNRPTATQLVRRR